MLRSQFLKLPEKGGRLLDEIKNTHPTLQADGLRPAVAHGGIVTKRVGEAGGKQEKGAQTTELCSPSGDQVDAVTETRGSSRERSPGICRNQPCGWGKVQEIGSGRRRDGVRTWGCRPRRLSGTEAAAEADAA